jgi:D-alanyl-D-alanine carboxypeptidase
MTAKARQLGMDRTVFRNASGLPDPEQHTTARDIATLALHLQRDFPDQYPLFSTAEFRFRNQVIPNHNHLLKQYPGTDGLKTGFINASGFNLAASAKHGEARVIGVVLGGPSSAARDHRMIELLDHGFAALQGANDVLVAVNEQPQTISAKIASIQATKEEGDTDDEEPPAVAPAPIKEITVATMEAPQGWGIQVGAFKSRGSAENQLERVRKLLPELSDAQPMVTTEGGKTQRARLFGLSEDQAAKACKRLKAKDMPCLMVAPG